MNKRVKKIFRRLIAVFVAVIIAAGIILMQAPGHILRATELTDVYAEAATRSLEEQEEETLDEEEVTIEIPALEEPVEEGEPAEEELVGFAAQPAGEEAAGSAGEEEAVPEEGSAPEEEPVLEETVAVRQVSVTFVVEGQAPEEIILNEGDAITLPEAPQKEGYRFIGWFIDDGTEVGEDYIVSDDLILTAHFTQDWIVTYLVNGGVYTSVAVENMAAIGQFPEDPEKEGAQFLGWFVNGHRADASEVVTADMTLEAAFGYTVNFVAEKDNTEEILERVVEEGETLGTLPSEPFWEGHSFLYWIDENGNEVTEDTVVISDMTVTGIFESVNIYKITVDYYYNDAAGVYHNIDRTVVTVDSRKVTDESPVQIASPPQYEIKEDGGMAAGIIYYPATQTTVITPADLREAADSREIERSVEYSSQAVSYSYVYLLRDLEGGGYSEIERTDGQAVIGSLVTPEVRNYSFAQQGVTEPYQIERDGQELPVYYERKTFSLVFDSMGGSSVAPVTVPYGTTVNISGFTPERAGYDFAGWYLDEALTRRAGNTFTVETRATVYAKWTGREVGYTIVYMKEKYDNTTGISTYVYDNSRTATASVGSTVYASSAPKLTNNINGYEADTEANKTSSTKIVADGSSVLTVYYKLIRYTLSFTHRTSGYSSASVSMNGNTYTNKNYTISGVVLGQDISSLWPYDVNSGKKGYSFTGWSYTNESGGSTNRVTKVTELTWELVAKANSSHTATFSANYKNNVTTKTVEYWLQQPDGKYVKDATLSQSYASTGTLGAKDINGYTKHNGDASAPAGYSGTSGNTSRFYYDRNSYSIYYYDGGEMVRSRTQIPFDSDISGEGYDFIPEAAAGEEDYTWGGWYSDASLNTKFSFTRMPANNVALYANWIPPQYTVNFHSNYAGVADIYDSQTVNRYSPAEEPDVPVRQYYRFLGWFTEAEGGRQYLAGSENVESDLDLYAHWEIIPLKYTVRYIDKTTGEVLFSEKEVESPVFTPGQQITEDAVVIAGYIPYDSKKSISLGYRPEDNQITFEYETKAGHTLTYTVEYVLLEDPSVHVAPNRQVSVEGTYASITETAAAVTVAKYSGYDPVEVTKTLQLGLNSESNILTFYYVPHGAVVNVRWLDMDGDPIPGMTEVNEYHKIGSTFTVNVSAGGYTLHHIEDNVSAGGVGSEEYTVTSSGNVNIVVYMQKDLKITAKSKSKVYDGNALTDSGVADVTVSGLVAGHVLESVTINGSQTLAGTSAATPSQAVISGCESPDYYNITYVSGSLTVVKTKVTINIEPDRWNDGQPYDGTERTIGFRNLRNDPEGTDGVVINNAVYEEKYGRLIRDMVRDITLTASDAGFYTIPAETIRSAITLPDDPGYEVMLNIRNGELTIPKAQLTITTESGSKAYDGSPLEVPGASAFGLVGGENITVTASGSLTDAGTAENTYDIVWNGAKESNYDITEDLGTLEVTRRNVTLTSPSASREYDGSALTGTEVIIGGDGFAPGEGATFEVSGSQTIAGSSVNSFEYTLNAGTNEENYNITKVEGLLTVTDRSAKYEITVKAKSGEYLYDGTNKQVEGLEQTEFTIDGNTYTVSGLTAGVSASDAGSYVSVIEGMPVVKDASGNEVTRQFLVNLENGSLNILKRQVVLTSGSGSREYNGQPLEIRDVTVGGNGFADGEGASYEYSGSQLLAGSSENIFEYKLNDGTNADNYVIRTVYGTLTVLNRSAKYSITVTANSAEYKYDGSEKSTEGLRTTQFTVDGREYFVEGFSANVSGTDAGEYANNVVGTAQVLDAYGNDVTGQFKVNTEPGTLKIVRREVVLTSADDAKEYDGTALTNQNVAVSGDGFAEGDGASFAVTGTRTLTGTAENSFTYTLNTNTKAENYDIRTVFGTLRIIERGEKYEIEVRAASSTDNVYDGTEKSVGGFETLEFTLNGVPYTVEGLTTSDPAETAAGTYANAVSGTAIVRDAGGNDVTANFNVRTVDGTLEIRKRAVTLLSGSESREYNGLPLTNGTVEILGEGFAEGEGASFTVSGVQLLPGSSANTFEYALNEGTSADNYEITKNEGTLTVESRAVKYHITVRAASDTVVYDGSGHEISSLISDTFTVEGITYRVEGLEAYGTGTDAGRYDVDITGTAVVRDPDGNDVTGEFEVERLKGTLKIDKRSVTLSSASEGKTYDGSALTFAGREAGALADGSLIVGGDGFAGAEGVDIVFTGSQTLPGSSSNTFEYAFKDNTNADNYKVAVSFGTLTVSGRGEDERFVITMTGNSSEALYDGAEHSVSGFVTDSFVVNGNRYTVEGLSSGAAQTHAGTYQTQITGTETVRDNAGNDVTDQFDVRTVPGELTIQPRTVKLISASAEKEYDGTALTAPEVTVEGDGFAEGEGAEYAFTGSQTISGTSENTFTYRLQGADAGDYNISQVFGSLKVTDRNVKAEITVVANGGEFKYDGQDHEVSGLTANGIAQNDDGSVIFTDNNGTLYVLSGLYAHASGRNAGDYPVIVEGSALITDENGNDVTDQFFVKVTGADLKISKRSVILTSGSQTREYDGNALINEEVTVSGDGFADGEGAHYYLPSSQTLPGTCENIITYELNDGTDAANYDIQTVNGHLTVTNRDALYRITVKAVSGEFMYNGLEQGVSGLIRTEFDIDENTYYVSGLSASASAVHAGTYRNVVIGTAVVSDADGNDVTAQFAVDTEDGELIITKRKVTITSADAAKVYDGGVLTDEEVTFSGDDFAAGEGVDISFTGSILLPGTAKNSFTWQMSGAALEDDYEITEVFGLLTVSDRDSEDLYHVTVTAHSGEFMYDGTEHKISGLDVTGNRINGHYYTVEGLSAEAAAVDAGSYDVQITGTAKVLDENGNDVTAQFSVKTQPGTLEITRRNIIFTSASVSKEYDGNDLTSRQVEISGDGFAQGEGAEFTVTGVQGIVGSSTNLFTYELNAGTKESNYNISLEYGTLTVTSRETKYELTVKANSLSTTYDGSEKTVSGIYTTEFVIGGNTYHLEGLDAEAKARDAGTYPVVITGTPKVLDDNGNDITDQFAVIQVNGTLEIARAQLDVKAVSAKKTYDGAPVHGGIESGIPDGAKVSFSTDDGETWSDALPELTGAGTIEYTARVEDDNYETAYAQAQLTVDRRSVIMTSADAEKEYDGDPLTNPVVTVSGDGFAEGEGADYEVTGSQLLTGISENTFTYTLSIGTDAANYDIRTEYGTLNVMNREALYQITVRAVSAEYMYDGQEQKAEGFIQTEFDIDGNTYRVEGLKAEGAAVHAGTYKVVVTGTPKVTDAQGNDVSDQFAVNTEDGQLVITRRSVIVTSADAAKTYDGSSLTNEEYSYSGDGFVSGEGIVVTFTGSLLLPGTAQNIFSWLMAGDTRESDYDITPVFGTLSVVDRGSHELYQITVSANSAEYKYDGSAHSAEGLSGLSININGHTYTVEGLRAGQEQTDAGTYIVEVEGSARVLDETGNDVTAQFDVQTRPGELKINRRNVILTSATVSKEYDGNALTSSTVEVSGDGFAEGEGAEYDVTGSQTIAGSSSNTFNYTLTAGTKADNYNITVNEGLLSVNSREIRYEITVKANSLTEKYDGSEKRISGFEKTEFVVEGNTFTVEGIEAAQTAVNAGNHTVAITGTPVVRDADGNDVTGQFAVNLENGSLDITARSVILTSASASREYDGNDLTAETVEVSGDGFAEGEGAAFTFSGKQNVVGMSANTFTYALNDNTLAGNYDVTVRKGTLTVTNRGARYEIEIAANSAEYLYDGTEKSVEGFVSTYFGIGDNTYTVEGLSAVAKETHAGTYTVTVEGTPVVRDKSGNDVSDQFRVISKAGTLTILQRSIVLSSGSATGIYTGRPLTEPAVNIGGDGFAEGEGVSINVTGSRTVVGFSENTFTYTLNDGTLERDYQISTEFGTLTVQSRPENARFEILVRAGSAEGLYDGNAHQASGISIGENGQDENGTVEFEVEGVRYFLSGLEASAEAVNAGEYPVNVTGNVHISDAEGNNVTDQFMISAESGRLSIGRRQVVLTSGSSTHAYTGRQLTNDTVSVSGDGFAAGEGASYDVSGSRTIPGISSNTFTYTLNSNTLAENYDITVVPGSLTVTNRDAGYLVTVSALSGEFLYDGTEKSVEGLNKTVFTLNDHQFTIKGLSAGAEAVDAGEYAVKVIGTPAIYDEEGNDVTAQFSVNAVDGLLHIIPRTVIFRSADATREYNGLPLTAPEVSVGGDGFADDEGADFFAESSRTLVGTSQNLFTWILKENTKGSNYIIQTEIGTLNVVNRNALYEITLNANSLEVLYDGEEHVASGFETDEFEIEGLTYRVEGLTSEARGTEPGKYSCEYTGQARVLDADGNDVTDQFAVSVNAGVLTIKGNYLLTLNYVDENGNELVESFAARYQPGEQFGPFVVPQVEGMVPEYDMIFAPEGGMPEQDLEINIVYVPESSAAPVPVTPDDDETPTEPESTNEPENPDGTEPQSEETQPQSEETQPQGGEPQPLTPTENEPRKAELVVNEETGEPELIDLPDEQLPLAPVAKGYWALVNLLLVLATVFTFCLIAVEYFMTRKKKDEEEEETDESSDTAAIDVSEEGAEEGSEEDENRKKITLKVVLLGLIPAIGSIIAFLLTEDMTNSVRLVDLWTILMVVIFALEVLLLIFGRFRKKTEEEEEEPEEEAEEA